jgi:hypothetical protein
MTGVGHSTGQSGTDRGVTGRLAVVAANSLDERRLIRYFELAIHGFQVISNGVRADEQLLGDRRNTQPRDQLAQDFTLPPRQKRDVRMIGCQSADSRGSGKEAERSKLMRDPLETGGESRGRSAVDPTRRLHLSKIEQDSDDGEDYTFVVAQEVRAVDDWKCASVLSFHDGDSKPLVPRVDLMQVVFEAWSQLIRDQLADIHSVEFIWLVANPMEGSAVGKEDPSLDRSDQNASVEGVENIEDLCVGWMDRPGAVTYFQEGLPSSE